MNNLEMMRKRFEFQGGTAQEDRMVKDKWRTFQRALKYSYQACTVQMVQRHDMVLNAKAQPSGFDILDFPIDRALINPDKVKQDYDDKILSIDKTSGFDVGDVFEWKGYTETISTNTYWIIYLRELSEDAYFRGEIRRCRHMIKFKDGEGNWCTTWAAIRGPVETQIESIQKNQIRVDRPNLSLNILMPRNDKTLHAFDRYSQFLFAGRCWQVQAPDSISMDNVIEVNAEEYYINRDTDDVENEMKNGLVIEPVNLTPNSDIQGETFIKPKIEEIYTSREQGGCWKVLEKDAPVTIKAIGGDKAQVLWTKSTSGQFTLQWRSRDGVLSEKAIVVESLF